MVGSDGRISIDVRRDSRVRFLPIGMMWCAAGSYGLIRSRVMKCGVLMSQRIMMSNVLLFGLHKLRKVSYKRTGKFVQIL